MAEGGGLLNRYRVSSSIVSSNLIPSATSNAFLALPGSLPCFPGAGPTLQADVAPAQCRQFGFAGAIGEHDLQQDSGI